MLLPHGNALPPDYVGGITETHNGKIQQAAANDDLAKVSEFIDGGIDVNSRHQGKTALYHAICNDSSAMMRLLLSRGADTSLRDGWDPDWPDRFTAVENAARLSAKAAMQELLAHGFSVEDSNALYFAACESNAEMLELLFDNAESSMSDAARQHAFAIALRESAGRRSCELVRWVLEKRGDERTRDDHWQGALDCAFLTVFQGLTGLRSCPNSQECDQAIQVLEILIEADASVNAHSDDSSKCTALHYTIQLCAPPKLVAFLLDHGADVNFRGPAGRSPFFQLLEHPKATEELVKMFTDAGAIIGPPDSTGQTGLHCVRKSSITSWLLKSGADICAVDDQGETPLTRLARHATLNWYHCS